MGTNRMIAGVVFCSLFAIFFQLAVFYPMYIGSFAGVHFASTFWVPIVLAVFAAAAALSFPFLFLSRRVATAAVFLFAVAATIFVNGAILPRSAALMDGGELAAQAPTPERIVSLAAVFFFCLVAAWFIRRRILAVSLFISLFVFICAVALQASAYLRGDISLEPETAIEPIRFSRDFNVVLIVVDSFPGVVAEKIFQEHPEEFSEFTGFTLFPRAVASFPGTSFSRPTIFSGSLYSSAAPVSAEENWRQAVEKSFVKELVDSHGFHATGFETFAVPGHSRNHSTASLAGDRGPYDRVRYAALFRAALIRVFGFLPERLRGAVVENEYFRMKANELKLYQTLPGLLAPPGDYPPHLLTAWDMSMHIPIFFRKDGTVLDSGAIAEQKTIPAGAAVDHHVFGLRNLASLLQSLKSKDLYDNSLILFLSDHGQIFPDSITVDENFFRDFPGFRHGNRIAHGHYPFARYNAVFLVKPPRAAGPARLSREPVWIGDARELVMAYNNNRSGGDPVRLVAAIRTAAPEIPVMLDTAQDLSDRWAHISDEHHFIEIRTLDEIYDRALRDFLGNGIWAAISESKPIEFPFGSFSGFLKRNPPNTLFLQDDIGHIKIKTTSPPTGEGVELRFHAWFHAGPDARPALPAGARPGRISVEVNGRILPDQDLFPLYGVKDPWHTVAVPAGAVDSDGELIVRFHHERLIPEFMDLPIFENFRLVPQAP